MEEVKTEMWGGLLYNIYRHGGWVYLYPINHLSRPLLFIEEEWDKFVEQTKQPD